MFYADNAWCQLVLDGIIKHPLWESFKWVFTTPRAQSYLPGSKQTCVSASLQCKQPQRDKSLRWNPPPPAGTLQVLSHDPAVSTDTVWALFLQYSLSVSFSVKTHQRTWLLKEKHPLLYTGASFRSAKRANICIYNNHLQVMFKCIFVSFWCPWSSLHWTESR